MVETSAPPAPLDKASLRDLLTALDAEALRTLAHAFNSVAAEASSRALRLDNQAEGERAARAHLARLAQLPELVAAAITEHHETADRAQLRVSAAEGVPVETVAAWWRTWWRTRRADSVATRRGLVIRRAREGARTAEIAAELGISRRTVERALKGQNWGKLTLAA